MRKTLDFAQTNGNSSLPLYCNGLGGWHLAFGIGLLGLAWIKSTARGPHDCIHSLTAQRSRSNLNGQWAVTIHPEFSSAAEMATKFSTKIALLAVTLIYLTSLAVLEVDCRIHRVKNGQNYNYSASTARTTSISSRFDLPVFNGATPSVIFFPPQSSASSPSKLNKKADTGSADLYTWSDAVSSDSEGGSSSGSDSLMSSLKARFGAKFGKEAQNKADGVGGGADGSMVQREPDIFSRIGSVLGILGLGVLFIAELTSSFNAPFLIPVLMAPLIFVVLLRLAWDGTMGMVNMDVWM